MMYEKHIKKRRQYKFTFLIRIAGMTSRAQPSFSFNLSILESISTTGISLCLQQGSSNHSNERHSCRRACRKFWSTPQIPSHRTSNHKSQIWENHCYLFWSLCISRNTSSGLEYVAPYTPNKLYISQYFTTFPLSDHPTWLIRDGLILLNLPMHTFFLKLVLKFPIEPWRKLCGYKPLSLTLIRSHIDLS